MQLVGNVRPAAPHVVGAKEDRSCDRTDLSRVRVLVAIPILNEEAHIESVVRSVVAERASFGSMLIAVVDGGSTDRSYEIVAKLASEQAGIELVRNPKRIQSAAINRAARQFGSQVDVLIRCDAHASYPADYCTRVTSTLLRVGADAVVVPMDSIGTEGVQSAVAWISNSPVGTGGSAHRGSGARSGFVDHGHHAAILMETFRMAGGYDETFSHNEDAEFDCRQRALGARIYLDSDVRVQYHPRSTLRGLWTQYYRYGRGRSRTARKHPGSLRLRQLAVVMHFFLFIATLAGSRYSLLFLLYPALYASALGGTSLWMIVRCRSVYALLTGIAAAIMHFAWACGFVTGFFTIREHVWTRESAVPLWLPATAGLMDHEECS